MLDSSLPSTQPLKEFRKSLLAAHQQWRPALLVCMCEPISSWLPSQTPNTLSAFLAVLSCVPTSCSDGCLAALEASSFLLSWTVTEDNLVAPNTSLWFSLWSGLERAGKTGADQHNLTILSKVPMALQGFSEKSFSGHTPGEGKDLTPTFLQDRHSFLSHFSSHLRSYILFPFMKFYSQVHLLSMLMKNDTF